VKYAVKWLFDAFLILGLMQINACTVERALWTLTHHFRRVLSCTEVHVPFLSRCLTWRVHRFVC